MEASLGYTGCLFAMEDQLECVLQHSCSDNNTLMCVEERRLDITYAAVISVSLGLCRSWD